MSGIKGRDTKPELMVRKILHRNGFRYRLHKKNLPGSPDVYLRKHNCAVFVHGCFWHGHNCHLFRWPKTRESFWREKIGSNIKRDRSHVETLGARGVRVLLVWECAMKGKTKLDLDRLEKELIEAITGRNEFCQITGLSDGDAPNPG